MLTAITMKSKCSKPLLTTRPWVINAQDEEGGCSERMEPVALLVCWITDGTGTPKARFEDSICDQMANQCLSWKVTDRLLMLVISFRLLDFIPFSCF